MNDHEFITEVPLSILLVKSERTRLIIEGKIKDLSVHLNLLQQGKVDANVGWAAVNLIMSQLATLVWGS